MSSRKSAKPAAKRRRWWIWAVCFLVGVLLLPVVQVIWVRYRDPSVTPLMLLRESEAHRAGLSQTRRYVWEPLPRIPHDFLKFVLIAEDQRFFQHRGFDWREVELARKQAARTGRPARGASTISMQCARSLFLWQGRSWVRKGLEVYYTFWMETLLSKSRILELYANVIEMGDGVYGIEAAAQAHFGTSAAKLNRDQCAALAAILPNPREWNPQSPSPQLAARISKIRRQEHLIKVPPLAPHQPSRPAKY